MTAKVLVAGDVTSFLQVPLRELDVRSWIGGGDNGIAWTNMGFLNWETNQRQICRIPDQTWVIQCVFTRYQGKDIELCYHDPMKVSC